MVRTIRILSQAKIGALLALVWLLSPGAVAAAQNVLMPVSTNSIVVSGQASRMTMRVTSESPLTQEGRGDQNKPSKARENDSIQITTAPVLNKRQIGVGLFIFTLLFLAACWTKGHDGVRGSH